MEKYNVLILGSGGRENALAWKIAQSPLLGELFVAPGNAGTKEFGINIKLNILDFQAIKLFVLKEDIHLMVVGPEEPLVKGIHDYFLADPLLQRIMVIGPEKSGALLEGSKDFAKRFMNRHGIPTAAYETFGIDNIEQGIKFLRSLKPPYVLKADGLAAGKGVVICNNLLEAESELKEMLVQKRFGSASESVVIEEYLDGIELSVFAITDGNQYIILPEAKDYKRIGENDSGPNTGGMGSVSPVPFADAEFMRKVEDKVIRPTVEGLKADGIPYCGFIFAGLMNVKGDPFVIEYNVRLGDPESEVVLPRIKSDLLELLLYTALGRLSGFRLNVDSRYAACIMLVSGGYPGSYEKGIPVTVSDSINESYLFHAGTESDLDNNTILTSGGRVIAVVSYGDSLDKALGKSYESISSIHFKGMYYRRDIGSDLMKPGK
jgi:phosphoribosylamine---glycine ligase